MIVIIFMLVKCKEYEDEDYGSYSNLIEAYKTEEYIDSIYEGIISNDAKKIKRRWRYDEFREYWKYEYNDINYFNKFKDTTIAFALKELKEIGYPPITKWFVKIKKNKNIRIKYSTKYVIMLDDSEKICYFFYKVK